MRLIKLECPSCKSNLKVEKNRKMTFCQYCGAQIYLDDEVKRSEHTYRKINETRIKELEFEERKEKRDNKVFAFSMIGLMLFVFIMFGSLYLMQYFNNKKAEEMTKQGMINPGFHIDYEKKNYEAVVTQLKNAGFTNIETVDLDDAGWFSNKEDTVDTVSIDGNSSFDGNYFSPDARILITYH